MAGEVLFVREPVDQSLGPQPGLGTPASPFESLQEALDAAKKLGGATIKLGPGHYIESTFLKDFEVDGAIVVEPDDGAAGQVYIDACRREFLFPQSQDHWNRAGPPNDGIDEYVWSRRYEPVGTGVDALDTGWVRSGALLDEPRHTRLIGYDRYKDFVATNQWWPDTAARPGGPG